MSNSIISVTKVCPICGKSYKAATMSDDAYNAWQNGVLIQYAMPELTATERESLISGICPDCQKRIFGSDEDYDDYEDEDYEEEEDDYYEEDEDDLDEDDYELFELDTEDDDEDEVDALAMLGALLGILSKS